MTIVVCMFSLCYKSEKSLAAHRINNTKQCFPFDMNNIITFIHSWTISLKGRIQPGCLMMNSHLGSNNFSEFNSGTIYLEEQIKNSGFKSVK